MHYNESLCSTYIRSSIAMYNNTSIKKSIIILVALLLCLSVIFVACDGSNAFKPLDNVTDPGGEAVGNGSAAVKYGDYLYYVNGSQSSVSANNEYTNEIRTGAIVRIKLSDIEGLIKIAEDNKDKDITSANLKKEIAKELRTKAQMVVPNFYYSANTTTTDINGIYILGGRIYITTPNPELTAGGNSQTSQLLVRSYKLDGSDMKTHFTFTSNSAQILLSQSEGSVYVTAFVDNAIRSIKLGDTEKAAVDTEICKTATSVNFEKSTSSVYYLDNKSNICQFVAGSDKATILQSNVQTEEGDEHKDHNHAQYTYTIKSVNNGEVFYTKADSKDSVFDNKILYKTSANGEVAVSDALPDSSYIGYGSGLLYVEKKTVAGVTLYGLTLTTDSKATASAEKVVLSAVQNDKSITLDKIVGNTLYYTADSVYYSVDLSASTFTHTPLAYSLDSSSSVWYKPVIVDNYVITLSSGGITAVKFKPEEKNNSESVSLLLTVEETTESK